ncbi:MAG: hypothetical protein ACTHML_06070 [Ginsengibacter sp.]
MLRKYGIGLGAIIIAVASAAFTVPKNRHLTATHVFEFKSSLAYTVPNVTQPSNWQYVGENEPLCGGADKACRIAVTDNYVDNSTPMKLSGVSISASITGSGEAAVTGITDAQENRFSNQDDE